MTTSSLSKFTAQISFRMSNGYGSTVGLKGDGKQAEPKVAVIEAMQNLVLIAQGGGFAEELITEAGATLKRIEAVQ